MKKKFVIVGTGSRAGSFIEFMATRYVEEAELCALCDLSQVRMDFHNRRLREFGCSEVPTYQPGEFERMLDKHRPDAVLICTVDATHHEYILRSLARGCDAISEKPMTTTAEGCDAILKAARASPNRVRVTFNYRWQGSSTKIKELLSGGCIGQVKSVTMEYSLDTRHGADYFRRWHSEKALSGGLLVHKATHHFDLVNWWLDSIPSDVFAWGALAFYGRENAMARGDDALTRYPRYTGQNSTEDPFSLNLRDGRGLEQLYLNAESETGYVRDRNVFREGISIEDTMSVLVKYRSGVVLNYSLNAFAPMEGYRVIFNGDRGRLEYAKFGGAHIIRGQTDAELSIEQVAGAKHESLRVYPLFEAPYEVDIPRLEGGHGGADPLLAKQIFGSHPPEELLGRNAGCEQGAASILVGIASNVSMESLRPVRIGDLVSLRPGARSLSELSL